MPGIGTLGKMDLANLLNLDRDHPDIFYINHDSFLSKWWITNTRTVDKKFLEFLTKYRLVIVDLSSEHFGDPKYKLTTSVEDNLKSVGVKDFVIITHLIEDHRCTPHIVFCPTEYHTSRKFIPSSQIELMFDNAAGDRSYSLSCMNNNCWTHRIYYTTKVYQKPWFKKTLYTINSSNAGPGRSDAIVLDNDTISIWEAIGANFQKRFQGNLWNIDNPAYKDSYAAIVLETVVLPGVYLSEKTWKAVASGMWFVILGCPGTMAHLRTLGVDIFDDIFDHSYYDNEPDFFKRVDKLNQVIDEYMQKDHVRLWRDTIDRRRSNIIKFRDGSFDPGYLQGIRDILRNN